jgi:hypothetical protein
LVDLLVARHRRRGAYLEVATVKDPDLAWGEPTVEEAVVEAVVEGTILQDVGGVHRVTGVGDALYPLVCIRVIAPAGDVKRLAGVPALNRLLT